MPPSGPDAGRPVQGIVSTKLNFSDEHNPFRAWVGPRHRDCNSFDALWSPDGRRPGGDRRGPFPPVPRVQAGGFAPPLFGNRIPLVVRGLGRPLGGVGGGSRIRSRQPAKRRRPSIQPGAAAHSKTGSHRLWGPGASLHRGPRSGDTPSHSRRRPARTVFPRGVSPGGVRCLWGRQLPGRPPSHISTANPRSAVRCRASGTVVLCGDRSRRARPSVELRRGNWNGAADSFLQRTLPNCRISLSSPVEWFPWLN